VCVCVFVCECVCVIVSLGHFSKHEALHGLLKFGRPCAFAYFRLGDIDPSVYFLPLHFFPMERALGSIFHAKYRVLDEFIILYWNREIIFNF